MSGSSPRNLCSGVRQRRERAKNGETVTNAGGTMPVRAAQAGIGSATAWGKT